MSVMYLLTKYLKGYCIAMRYNRIFKSLIFVLMEKGMGKLQTNLAKKDLEVTFLSSQCMPYLFYTK